jgi:hypothetical protein
MMPFPPDAARLIILGFVILGFFGVAYMRGNSFKSKVMCLLLLFVILVCTASAWFAMSSVSMTTELHVYAQKQPVHFLLGPFGSPYQGGTFIYQSGPYPMEKASGFTFYKLNGSNWEELNTECDECVFIDCVNDTPIERYQLSQTGPCRQITDATYVWNQTVYATETVSCGGLNYVNHVQRPVGSGRYRVELCYGKAFNYDWDMPACTTFSNTPPTCVETEFFVR